MKTQDLFPYSNHVRLVELASASDRVVFTRVSLDSDFAEMAALLGSPPKVIWLRCGNQPTSAIEKLLRGHSGAIAAFQLEATAACLEIY